MSLLPPTYDEHCTQLLISPSPGAVQFQKGYLGAQGERAAIEGELQIKGTEEGQWDSAQVVSSTSFACLPHIVYLQDYIFADSRI